MMAETLRQEFEQEVESTRRLKQAVPQKDLHYKPSDISWTMGQLAQHIAMIYYWYVGTLTKDVYDIDADQVNLPSVEDIHATIKIFESHVEQAREALSSLTDADLLKDWTMKMGEETVLGPLPRGQVARSFLFNHIYHHRGEMIVYLRALGNKVPGMYGPVYEDGVS